MRRGRRRWGVPAGPENTCVDYHGRPLYLTGMKKFPADNPVDDDAADPHEYVNGIFRCSACGNPVLGQRIEDGPEGSICEVCGAEHQVFEDGWILDQSVDGPENT